MPMGGPGAVFVQQSGTANPLHGVQGRMWHVEGWLLGDRAVPMSVFEGPSKASSSTVQRTA